MKYKSLNILLPCHSLEDFPIHYEGEEAQGLLAAWTALWHPALIAAAESTPQWIRADDPPQDLADRLLVAPQVSESLLLAGWPARTKNEGAVLIRKPLDRDALVREALANLDGGDQGISPDLCGDFLALGYAYLQEELLTRQMRYMSHLDDAHFQSEVLRAAQAAARHDDEEARRGLQSCFDVLTEARERFYPAEAYLVDLTLASETTAGAALAQELRGERPVNLLLTAKTLEHIASHEPDTMTALREALQRGTLTLVGGEWTERELPLLPPETIARELAHGRDAFERLTGQAPEVYGRRRFGLTPLLPQILARSGYIGAIHSTLDDGTFPRADQSKTRWEGTDSSALDALSRVPLDAALPETFLALCSRLSETMDRDHVATVVFAHWPGRTCPWYDDLQRIGRYSPVMGRFSGLKDWFTQTYSTGSVSKFHADQYRSPYLKQSIIRRQPNPQSRFIEEYESDALRQYGDTLSTFAGLLARKSSGHGARDLPNDADLHFRRLEQQRESLRHEAASQPSVGGTSRAAHGGATTAGSAHAEEIHSGPEGLSAAEAIAVEAGAPENGQSYHARLTRHAEEAAASLSAAIPRSKEEGGEAAGVMVFNPLNFTRRMVVELPTGEGLPAVGDVVKAVQGPLARPGSEIPACALVEVPGLGYAWFPQSAGRGASRSSEKHVPLAVSEEGTFILRNEIFEIYIDPRTGALRSTYDYKHRGNRLSQQLALRQPGPRPRAGDSWFDPDEAAIYSSMEGELVEIVSAGPVFGQIVSHGRLVAADGKQLARFRQTYRLVRGSRILEITVELDELEEPRADPWNSYYAARFAWGDDSAEPYRNVGLTAEAAKARRLEAPLFVDLRGDRMRTTILTGGLPYHRLSGDNMLDAILVLRGESRRKFRLGVAIDIPHPAAEAVALLSPTMTHRDAAGAPRPAHSWLFHLDARNAIATHWSLLRDEEGRIVGYRARWQETSGKATRSKLRSFRAPAAARQVDFRGETLAQLPIEGDAVTIDFAAYEWVEIEVKLG